MKKLYLALAITSAITGAQVSAADINFSGYGSIRAGLTLDDDHFPRNFDYDDKIDFKPESVFALQAQTNINKDWSATLVMQARGEDDFELDARWAYLNYRISPETTLTMGRFALPYFRNSDTQDIGYSHNYSKMPRSIYRGQEFDVIEGVRLTHATYVGDGDITFKGSFGSFSGQASTANGDVDTKLNNIVQLSVEYSYEWFSVFAGILNAEIALDIDDQLDGGLMASLPGYTVRDNKVYNPANVAVYDMTETYMDEDNTLYISTGFTIDLEEWIFNAEYATYEIEDSFSETSEAYYVSAGYRFDRTTISLVVEDVKFADDYDNASSADPFVNGYLSAVNDSFARPSEYDSQGIHVRYDASAGIAYKLEYTYATDDLEDESNSIVTFGVDFVF